MSCADQLLELLHLVSHTVYEFDLLYHVKPAGSQQNSDSTWDRTDIGTIKMDKGSLYFSDSLMPIGKENA